MAGAGHGGYDAFAPEFNSFRISRSLLSISSLEHRALQEITVKMAESLKFSQALSAKVDVIDKKVTCLATDVRDNQAVLISKLDEVLIALSSTSLSSSPSIVESKHKRDRSGSPTTTIWDG